MALPALPSTTDIRSITERVNAIIKQIYNLVIPIGAADTVLTSDGTTLSWEALPTAGDTRVLQVVSTQTGAVATGTTQIPGDDSIPQITEGDEYMTRSITPKSASSSLIVEVTGVFATGAASGQLIVALFRDATANALAAVSQHINGADRQQGFKFTHIVSSGSTSATTFRVRAGQNSAATITFNGNSGGRIMGGVMASSIVITEVL